MLPELELISVRGPQQSLRRLVDGLGIREVLVLGPDDTDLASQLATLRPQRATLHAQLPSMAGLRGRRLIVPTLHEGPLEALEEASRWELLSGVLASVARQDAADSFVLLDGLAHFQVETSDAPEDRALVGFPRVDLIAKALHCLLPGWRPVVLGDQLLLGPQALLKPSPLLSVLTASRFASIEEAPSPELLAAEAALGGCRDQEARTLADLAACRAGFGASHEARRGAHYLLWDGLVRAGRKQFEAARDRFEGAVLFGLAEARVAPHLAAIAADTSSLR